MSSRSTCFLALLAFASGTRAQEAVPVMEGLPEHLVYVYTQERGATPPSQAQEQLYAQARRWEPGRVLRVCTFGGNATVARLIREIASEWNGISSISLDFGPVPFGYNCLSPNQGFFQIRVGFSDRGYWSVLGRDSERLLDPLSPSMNLAGFNRIYSEARYPADTVANAAEPYHVATIRHEFGHALALLHEHQNPSLKCFEQIRWTGAGNVYEYFAGSPNYWSAAQVDRNLGFIGQTDPDYVSGEADPKSVMMYSLPAGIFKEQNGACAVSVNYQISNRDRAVVAAM